jgi:hypothetical protein
MLTWVCTVDCNFTTTHQYHAALPSTIHQTPHQTMVPLNQLWPLSIRQNLGVREMWQHSQSSQKTLPCFCSLGWQPSGPQNRARGQDYFPVAPFQDSWDLESSRLPGYAGRCVQTSLEAYSSPPSATMDSMEVQKHPTNTTASQKGKNRSMYFSLNTGILE